VWKRADAVAGSAASARARESSASRGGVGECERKEKEPWLCCEGGHFIHPEAHHHTLRFSLYLSGRRPRPEVSVRLRGWTPS